MSTSEADRATRQRRALKKIEAWAMVASLDLRDELIYEATEAGVPSSLVANLMGISTATVTRARRKIRKTKERADGLGTA